MDKKTKIIMTRVTEKEYNRISALVERSGLSMSVWLRKIIMGYSPLPSPTAVELMKTRMEINRIGVNINQLTQRAHAFGTLDVEQLTQFEADCRSIINTFDELLTKGRVK